jgi:acyl-coenzyme A synthetase/AMP-(fatty) acid ligase
MTADSSWWGDALLAAGDPAAPWAVARRQVTRGEMRKEVETLARILEAHQIRAGATVAVHGPPGFTQIWSVFALWSIGAQVVLVPSDGAGPDRPDELSACAPQFLLTLRRAGVHGAFVEECEILVERLPGGRPATSSHCIVLFSSGTTGRPKAVGRTSESLLVEVDRWRMLPGMPGPGDRVAVLEPLTRSFGRVGGVMCALDAGATVVFPVAWSPAALVAAVGQADVVLGSPQHFSHLVCAPGADALQGLRLAVSGGDVLPRPVAESFWDRYGVRVGQAYGITETGLIAADLAGGPDPATVGGPVPGVRTLVSDGVLHVLVPQCPYPFEPQPRPGGWMRTGDLVTADPGTGILRLRGRVSESGHTRLDLLEIESVLRAHDLVTDAVVLGPDPIEAHVESAADLSRAELRSWCSRFLADAATPASYSVFRKLPRTASGKARRIRRVPGGREPDPHQPVAT